MEIIGGLVIVVCIWYAQNKPKKKVEKPQKKPDITVEVVFNNEDRNKGLDS